VRGIWEGGEGWKAPPFRLPCRFSDYRALISTSGQIKLDDHDDDDDDDDAEERRKGKSALGARERGVGVVYPVELLGVRHSFRGGLRIPGVPPFDPIASCPGLPPAYVFTPISSPPLASRPLGASSSVSTGEIFRKFHGEPRSLYIRGYETIDSEADSRQIRVRI